MSRFVCFYACVMLAAAPAVRAASTPASESPGVRATAPRLAPPRRDPDVSEQGGADAADSVLRAIQRATVTRYVRYDRMRKRGAPHETEAGRDSTLVSASWLLRFERECGELPPAPCRALALVAGQTYAYNARIVAPEAPGAPRVDLDFRGLCARFVRDGRVVAGRTMIGREREMVALLRRLRPQDTTIERLAAAFEPPPEIEALPSPEQEIEPAPPAPPALGEYVYVEELPEPIHREPPEYPDAARAAGTEGTVVVQALVGTDGRVTRTQVTRGVPMLNEAAEACVRKWVFKPARSAGKPVVVWVAVPIAFKLH